MPSRRRIARTVLALVGIALVIVLIVNNQVSLSLPYGIGPYIGGSIVALGIVALDRLVDILAGKEKKSTEEPVPISEIPASTPILFESELSPNNELSRGDIVYFKVKF